MEREHNYQPEVTYDDKGFKIESRLVGDKLKVRIHKRTKDLVPVQLDFSMTEAHALREYLNEILDAFMFEEEN